MVDIAGADSVRKAAYKAFQTKQLSNLDGAGKSAFILPEIRQVERSQRPDRMNAPAPQRGSKSQNDFAPQSAGTQSSGTQSADTGSAWATRDPIAAPPLRAERSERAERPKNFAKDDMKGQKAEKVDRVQKAEKVEKTSSTDQPDDNEALPVQKIDAAVQDEAAPPSGELGAGVILGDGAEKSEADASQKDEGLASEEALVITLVQGNIFAQANIVHNAPVSPPIQPPTENADETKINPDEVSKAAIVLTPPDEAQQASLDAASASTDESAAQQSEGETLKAVTGEKADQNAAQDEHQNQRSDQSGLGNKLEQLLVDKNLQTSNAAPLERTAHILQGVTLSHDMPARNEGESVLQANSISSDQGAKGAPSVLTPLFDAGSLQAQISRAASGTETGFSLASAKSGNEVAARTDFTADPAIPLGMVPLEIGMKALSGATRFDIRLDPAELGRIDVRLDIDDKGELSAHLTVERVETLMLLQRDAKMLERAFDQAGLKTSDASINMSLRDQQGQGQSGGFQQQNERRGSSRDARAIDGVDARDTQTLSDMAAIRRMMLHDRGGVDVRV
jgi:flagellar hook-length control protein FliK